MGILGSKVPRRLHLLLCDGVVVDVSVNQVRLRRRVLARWPAATAPEWRDGVSIYRMHTTEQVGVISTLWDTASARPTIGAEA